MGDVQPPVPGVPAANEMPVAVTVEELMSSGHELHESYTCPLCCLPVALPTGEHSSFKSCCVKLVCDGCTLASHKRGMGDTCPFCRAPTPEGDAAALAQVQKRVDARDPAAMKYLANAYHEGKWGLQQDDPRAIELWTEAARLGDLDAHYALGCKYYYGVRVERDAARGTRHCQHAAIGGHPQSRHRLGIHEYENGNHKLAIQHFIISAKMGWERSLKDIKHMFTKGHATKAHYATALRGYQNALEETRSPQREEAKTFLNQCD